MRSKWIQAFMIFCITVALTWAIASCQTSLGDRPIVLTLSGWGADPTEQRLLQQMIDQFEASHPQIDVKLEAIADQYMDVIKTRLIGDAAADIFYLDAFEAPPLLGQNVLEPLDRFITPDFDLADFSTNLLAPFQAGNQTYGLPKDCSTLALFYNQQAFAEAGVTQPPQTWAEMVAIARKLTRKDANGKITRYGLGITPELARQAFLLSAFGGQVVDAQGHATFASEAALRGLDLVVQPYVNPSRIAAQPSDVGTHSGTEMLGQGKAAMVLEGSWAIPFLRNTFSNLKFGTAEVPTVNQKKGTMVYTVAYVMNRRSEHKAEAWQLISYLTNQKGMAQWTGTGFALPTRRSLLATMLTQTNGAMNNTINGAMNNAMNDITNSATKALENRLRQPLMAGIPYATVWQVGSHPTPIKTHFDNQFVSALLGQQPLPQAMQRAQQEANEQIQASL